MISLSHELCETLPLTPKRRSLRVLSLISVNRLMSSRSPSNHVDLFWRARGLKWAHAHAGHLASIYDVFSSIRNSCCVIFHLWALKASEIYCLIYLVRILVRFSGARFLRRHLCTLAKTLDSTVQSDKGTINVLIRIYKSYRFDKNV